MEPAAGAHARPRIFVSYRRADSEAVVGRLVADLQRAFSDNQVFQDWASIAPGEDFVVALERELGNCAAALVVIGPRWLSAKDAGGRRRLDDPEDWVSREIAECLGRDGVRVFPLLVDGAQMPAAAELPEAIRGLARRQALQMENRNWEVDLGKLVAILRGLPELQPTLTGLPPSSPRGTGDGRVVSALASSTGDGGPSPGRTGAGKRWASLGGVAVAIVVGLVIAKVDLGQPEPPETVASEPALPNQGPVVEPEQPSARVKPAVVHDPYPPIVSEPSDSVARSASSLPLPPIVTKPVGSVAPSADAEPRDSRKTTTARKYQSGETFRDCSDCPEMVVVPAGEFMMGSPEAEKGRDLDEGPQRRVRIGQPFAVGKFEVTFEQWDACVAGGGCSHEPGDQTWGRGSQPVIDVSWNDAQRYLQWLSKKTGHRYRLLSEAEWEYAARAGTTTRYPWGDESGRNNANFGGSGSRWSGQQTAPVGRFGANRFGLHDMIGNVWEWVEDCWQGSYQGALADGSASTSASCSPPVVRGGSWNYVRDAARSASRSWVVPGFRVNYVGFRLARTL